MNRFIVSSILTAAFAITSVAAQRPSPEAAQQQEKAPTPLTGELLTIDTDAKTFAIKTATEGEVKFSYSEQTQIEGADKGVSGLVASPETELTVHYDSHGTARVALRIEVRQKK